MSKNQIDVSKMHHPCETNCLRFCIEGEEIMTVTRDGTVTIKDDGIPLDLKAQKFFDLLGLMFKEAGGIK